MAGRQVRPIAWARQEQVSELIEGVIDLNDAVSELAVALVRLQNDVSAIQESLYEPEAVDVQDPRVKAALREVWASDESAHQQYEEDEETTGFVDDLGPVPEAPTDEELAAEGEGMPERESESQRQVRVNAARARRSVAIREQGLKDFEDGNESPEAAATDVNDVVGVPEEGVVIDPGKDV